MTICSTNWYWGSRANCKLVWRLSTNNQLEEQPPFRKDRDDCYIPGVNDYRIVIEINLKSRLICARNPWFSCTNIEFAKHISWKTVWPEFCNTGYSSISVIPSFKCPFLKQLVISSKPGSATTTTKGLNQNVYRNVYVSARARLCYSGYLPDVHHSMSSILAEQQTSSPHHDARALRVAFSCIQFAANCSRHLYPCRQSPSTTATMSG